MPMSAIIALHFVILSFVTWLMKPSANSVLLCSMRSAGLPPSGAAPLGQGQAPSQAKLRVPAYAAPSPAELAQVQMKQQAKQNMKAAYTMVAEINSFAPPPQVRMPLQSARSWLRLRSENSWVTMPWRKGCLQHIVRDILVSAEYDVRLIQCKLNASFTCRDL